MTAYSITEAEILDEDARSRYIELSKAAVAQFGGRFLVQCAQPTAAEGEWPSQQRIVIIEFPTMDQLRAWYDSPEYADARALARTAFRRRLLFAQGLGALSQPDEHASDCARPARPRPMIMRWISDVPSKIVKILAVRAVSAGQRPAGPPGISRVARGNFTPGLPQIPA